MTVGPVAAGIKGQPRKKIEHKLLLLVAGSWCGAKTRREGIFRVGFAQFISGSIGHLNSIFHCTPSGKVLGISHKPRGSLLLSKGILSLLVKLLVSTLAAGDAPWILIFSAQWGCFWFLSRV